VTAVKHIATGRAVARKSLRVDTKTPGAFLITASELRIWEQMIHRNILPLLDYFLDPKEFVACELLIALSEATKAWLP
jgi:hypothetical protein